MCGDPPPALLRGPGKSPAAPGFLPWRTEAKPGPPSTPPPQAARPGGSSPSGAGGPAGLLPAPTESPDPERALLVFPQPSTFQDRLFYSHFRKKGRPREGQCPARVTQQEGGGAWCESSSASLASLRWERGKERGKGSPYLKLQGPLLGVGAWGAGGRGRAQSHALLQQSHSKPSIGCFVPVSKNKAYRWFQKFLEGVEGVGRKGKGGTTGRPCSSASLSPAQGCSLKPGWVVGWLDLSLLPSS